MSDNTITENNIALSKQINPNLDNNKNKKNIINN